MTKKTFFLPDLGEGLPDAEIVEWLAKVGETVMLDQPLVSMETAKAVVEVPSPFSGKLLRTAGGPGDVITTGAWLVEMELDESLPQRAASGEEVVLPEDLVERARAHARRQRDELRGRHVRVIAEEGALGAHTREVNA